MRPISSYWLQASLGHCYRRNDGLNLKSKSDKSRGVPRRVKAKILYRVSTENNRTKGHVDENRRGKSQNQPEAITREKGHSFIIKKNLHSEISFERKKIDLKRKKNGTT